MSELIKSIIFAILGAVVLATGIFIKAGWEVIGLGAVIVAFSSYCIISNIVKTKKANK